MRPHSGATASARSAQETSVEKIISKSQMLGGQLFQNRPLAADLVVVHRIIMVDCSVYTRCRVGGCAPNLLRSDTLGGSFRMTSNIT
jgi:hypothetical protein